MCVGYIEAVTVVCGCSVGILWVCLGVVLGGYRCLCMGNGYVEMRAARARHGVPRRAHETQRLASILDSRE